MVLVGLTAAGYVAFAILWHITANHLNLPEATRSIGKGIWLAAAGLLFVLSSLRLTTKLSCMSVLKGAAAIALGSFVLALIEGWRTEWGEACNQCGGAWLWPLTWPLATGALAFVGGLIVGGAATTVQRLRGRV
jgi:amino acid permease